MATKKKANKKKKKKKKMMKKTKKKAAKRRAKKPSKLTSKDEERSKKARTRSLRRGVAHRVLRRVDAITGGELASASIAALRKRIGKDPYGVYYECQRRLGSQPADGGLSRLAQDALSGMERRILQFPGDAEATRDVVLELGHELDHVIYLGDDPDEGVDQAMTHIAHLRDNRSDGAPRMSGAGSEPRKLAKGLRVEIVRGPGRIRGIKGTLRSVGRARDSIRRVVLIADDGTEHELDDYQVAPVEP